MVAVRVIDAMLTRVLQVCQTPFSILSSLFGNGSVLEATCRGKIKGTPWATKFWRNRLCREWRPVSRPSSKGLARVALVVSSQTHTLTSGMLMANASRHSIQSSNAPSIPCLLSSTHTWLEATRHSTPPPIRMLINPSSPLPHLSIPMEWSRLLPPKTLHNTYRLPLQNPQTRAGLSSFTPPGVPTANTWLLLGRNSVGK